jgi:xanthine dehydrogenase accessory factor
MQREIYNELRACMKANQLVVLATVVSGPDPGGQLLIWPGGETLGDLGSPRLNQRAALYAEQILPTGQTGRKSFRWNQDAIDAFFEVYSPAPELIVVGAGHVAIPLVRFAKVLGFRNHVVDPRGTFATRERFQDVDSLLVEWPEEALPKIGLHAGTCIAVLSHDLKIDTPALELALRSPARYIGVLGSRKTHAKRESRLREAGFKDLDLARIHSPIGLDLGGRSAEEIALSVIAEIVAAGNGRATRVTKPE